MNELDYRRRLNQLPREREPQTDLWPGIAARIADRAAPRRRLAPLWAAVALLVVGLGLVRWMDPSLAPATTALVGPTAAAQSLIARVALAAEYAGALRSLSGGRALQVTDLVQGDAELNAAARELSSAQGEINNMLEQRPDALFLIDLLKRNHRQQLRLAKRGALLT